MKELVGRNWLRWGRMERVYLIDLFESELYCAHQLVTVCRISHKQQGVDVRCAVSAVSLVGSSRHPPFPFRERRTVDDSLSEINQLWPHVLQEEEKASALSMSSAHLDVAQVHLGMHFGEICQGLEGRKNRRKVGRK